MINPGDEDEKDEGSDFGESWWEEQESVCD